MSEPRPSGPEQPTTAGSNVWHNFAQLVTGRLTSAIFTLLATACMARALGPAEFGLVVLMHTYVLTLRALLNVKPGDTFVRFGVPLIDAVKSAPTDGASGVRATQALSAEANPVQSLQSLNQLLGLVRSFEWVSMLLATAVAVLAAPLLGPWLGMADDAIAVLMGYSLVLLTSPVGTARGFCRAIERFDVLRTALAIGPAVRLLGVLLVWQLGGSWQHFALVWAISLAVSYVYLWWRGARLIKDAGYAPQVLSWRRAGQTFPGLPSFVGVVYSQGVLDQLPRHLITLLIGGLLGTASAGLYRVAREIADVLAKPVQLIRQAAFTEITRLGSRSKAALSGVFLRYGLRMVLPAVGLVCLASYFRVELLTLVGGSAFTGAALLLVLLLVAAAVDLVGAILRPIAYAYGHAGAALRVQVLAMLCYVGVFVALSQSYGLHSVGIAAIAAASVTLTVLGGLVWRWSRQA